jgi:hypothetical protein
MAFSLEARLTSNAGTSLANVPILSFVIAGWTGRDPAAVEKHIVELEAIGVARPASTPIFYRAAARRLTTDAVIECTGTASSGEVEFAILNHEGRLWIGVGSDHTDREVEAYGVTVSKQLCDKPVAPDFWPLDELTAHWDQLTLRSWIEEDGERKLYQEGSVAAMLAPQTLMAKYGSDALSPGTLMFCGTLGAKGGVRPAARFMFSLEDPVLNRRIEHAYEIVSLPVLG